MKTSILTLFPEYFDGMKNTSVIKRGLEQNLYELELINYRDFSTDKHHHVDDTPYGGGQGMVLKCEPIISALRSVQKPESKVVLLSPQGKPFDQSKAKEYSRLDHLILICGHYEGCATRFVLKRCDT